MKIRMPFLSTSAGEDIGLGISLIWLWWLLGINIAVYFLISLVILLKLTILSKKTGRRIILPHCLLPLIGMVASYAFSIAINAKDFSAGRVAAGINNLSIWIMGIIVITAIYNLFDESSIILVTRSLFTVGVIITAFSVIAIVLWLIFKKEIMVYSPAYYLIPGSIKEQYDLVKQSTELVLIGRDWFSLSDMPRISTFFPYPVALGGAMLMIIPISSAVMHQRSKPCRVFSFIMLQIPLLLSLSRLSVLVFWSVKLVVGLMKKKAAVIPAILIITVPLLVISFSSLLNAYDYILKLREGSSMNRLALYRDTISLAMESPVIGWGVKPTHDTLLIRVGSHSTYIGLLYKTGLVGLLLYVLFLGALAAKCIGLLKNGNSESLPVYLAMAFFSMVLWQVGEDIDAPHSVAFVYFVIIGIILRIERNYVQGKRNHTLLQQAGYD